MTRTSLVVAWLVVAAACGEEEPDVRGSVSVFLGNGDGTFRARSDYEAETPRSLAIADFDRDGFDDVAAVGYGLASVLRGNGDGTFELLARVDCGTGPGAITTADLNGDGAPDLATANTGSEHEIGPIVSVVFGDGKGGFAKHVDYPGAYYSGIAAADFNADGHVDISIPGYGKEVRVLPGAGDGTLQPALQSATGNGPYGLAAADLNDDGKIDLVTANWRLGLFEEQGTTISVLLGRGDGAFESPMDIEVGRAPTRVAVGDLNRDGAADLLVTRYAESSVVLLGRGDGTFSVKQQIYPTSPSNAALGDFDGDGILDMAGVVNSRVEVALGVGDGSFQAATRYETNPVAYAIAISDLNMDGALDLVVANEEGSGTP